MNPTWEERIAKLGELKTREQELLRRRVPPRIMCEDITGEKMSAMLEAHGETMASLSSDARSSCKIMLGKYLSSGSDEDVYLKGWSADSTRQDRISRAGIALDSPAISVAWAVQTGIFNQVLNDKSLAESGLLPRFIFCRVAPDLGAPTSDESSSAVQAEAEFGELVTSLLSTYRQHGGDTWVITATPEARQAFGAYQYDISEGIKCGDLSDIASFATRWAEIAWKIALIFHCASHRTTAHTEQLAGSTATSAIAVMKWYADHQRSLLAEAIESADDTRAAVALSYVNSLVGGATARDLQRFKQTLFPKVADARAVLDQLETEGAVTADYSGRSKRFVRKQIARRN